MVLRWIGISLALHIPACLVFCYWANRKHLTPRWLRDAVKKAALALKTRLTPAGHAVKNAPLTLAALLLIVGGPLA